MNSSVTKQPLISVIVPVYNIIPYLPRCVESLRTQTYENLEILPVLNKIDLPAADPQRVKDEIENILALPAQDA
mgnify:CR=1 FL=1